MCTPVTHSPKTLFVAIYEFRVVASSLCRQEGKHAGCKMSVSSHLGGLWPENRQLDCFTASQISPYNAFVQLG